MTCQSCDSNSKVILYPDLLHQCSNCGLIRADEQYFAELDAEKLYGEEYFNGAEYESYETDKGPLQKNFDKRVDYIVNNFQHINHVLEIGCAYGYFYESLKNKNDCKYEGIDVANEAIAQAINTYGPYFKAGNFLQENYTQKFTDVFMWDVIEHLDQPSSVFKKIHSHLKPDGRVYITTGDIGAMLPRCQGENWRMIHPPSHLFYFSKKSITTFLNNHGFEVVKLSYPPIYRSIRLIYYSLFLLKKKKKSIFHEKIFQMLHKKWYLPINTYDIMFVVAQKKSNE